VKTIVAGLLNPIYLKLEIIKKFGFIFSMSKCGSNKIFNFMKVPYKIGYFLTIESNYVFSNGILI